MKEFYNRQINSTQLNSIENQSKTDAAQVESKGGIEDSEKDREIKSVEWSDKTMELINAATLLPVRYLDTSRRNAIDMCIHIVIIIIIMGFCIYSETKSLSLSCVVVCRRSRRAMSLRIVQVPTSFCLSLSLRLFHWSSQSRLRFLLTADGRQLETTPKLQISHGAHKLPNKLRLGACPVRDVRIAKIARSCISCIAVNLLK